MTPGGRSKYCEWGGICLRVIRCPPLASGESPGQSLSTAGRGAHDALRSDSRQIVPDWYKSGAPFSAIGDPHQLGARDLPDAECLVQTQRSPPMRFGAVGYPPPAGIGGNRIQRVRRPSLWKTSAEGGWPKRIIERRHHRELWSCVPHELGQDQMLALIPGS